MPSLLLAAALLACTTTTTTVQPGCEVEVLGLAPESAAPGEAVRITARPLTTDFDTAVSFGEARGEILSVDREDCTECDACRDLNECTPCGDCSACDLSCEQTCEESLEVLVPELEAGTVALQLFNSHGASGRVDFEVLTASGGDDTGGAVDDTGSSSGDTGAASGDTGSAGSGSGAPPSPQGTAPGSTPPSAEGAVMTEQTCEVATASAMSPR